MKKLIYLIFLSPFIEVIAMNVPANFVDKATAAKKIIAVVNALPGGVYAQIYHADDDEAEEPQRKVWLRGVSMGRVAVTPPRSPSTPHVLVIKDSHDAQVLAQLEFHHPEEHTTFGVVNDTEGVRVKEISTLGVAPYDVHHK